MNPDSIDRLLSPAEIVEHFGRLLGDGLVASSVYERFEGRKTSGSVQIWLTIDRRRLKEAVRTLIGIHFPHLTVISGCDVGDDIELNYHFYIYYGRARGEYGVFLKTLLPKSDPAIDTITDMIPGALTSEREKQEFFGVTITGIPDSRRMFLPDDFPEGVHPWRKDETGIQEHMVKKLYEVGKEPVEKRREAAAAAPQQPQQPQQPNEAS